MLREVQRVYGVMRKLFGGAVIVCGLFQSSGASEAGAASKTGTPAQQRFQTTILRENDQTPYYWKRQPAGDRSELLTLFCRTCQGPLGSAGVLAEGTPLVSVLRDTLGGGEAGSGRITYVWLLTYTQPNLGRRMLSAVPFFYWRVGGGSSVNVNKLPKALLNVSAPLHPMIEGVSRQIVQFAAFDPMTMPIRASSRAYGSNETDNERLHLEEAVNYLHSAPVSEAANAPTQTQLDTLIARLQLRKKLLGGFVADRDAANMGEASGFGQERIRTRNWELLRQCADKTDLLFEPLALAGTSQQYAILWYQVQPAPQPHAAALDPIWKLLNVEDPSVPGAILNKDLYTQRALDADGSLLPLGESGARNVTLVPLGVYSLNYPTQPLLLVDFRHTGHLRRHEMTQRSINEIVSGIIGISHFTNWYYYVGADLYDFYTSRHGNAMNKSARLDCYAQFRVQLALDRSLDPDLRQLMQRRVDSLAVNPLESAPGRELATAAARYALLQESIDDPEGPVAARVDKERRAELAALQSTANQRVFAEVLHTVTFGGYTKRAPASEEKLELLDSYRRVQDDLGFLDGLVAAGTPPEIGQRPEHVQNVVSDLQTLLPDVDSSQMRAHAERTLLKVQQLSGDTALRAGLSSALASVKKKPVPDARPQVAMVTGTP
jgi:hypothetical protein